MNIPHHSYHHPSRRRLMKGFAIAGLLGVGLNMLRSIGALAADAAGWPVEVRYSYEENGRLQVDAKLLGHGAQVTTEFIRDNSLDNDDLMLWAECLAGEAKRQDW